MATLPVACCSHPRPNPHVIVSVAGLEEVELVDKQDNVDQKPGPLEKKKREGGGGS